MNAGTFRAAAQLGARLIRKSKLSELYDDLAKRLDAAAASPQSNQGPEITRTMGRIDQAHQTAVAATQLTPGQTDAWQILGVDQVIGPKAMDHLRNVFGQHIGNYPDIANGVREFKGRSLTVAAYCDQIAQNAANLQSPSELAHLPALRVHCKGNVDVHTLEDMAARADEWHLILTTFAQLTGAPARSPVLRDLERGSLIIDIIVQPEVWKVVAAALDIIGKGLSALSSYLTLKKQLADAGLQTEMVDRELASGKERVSTAAAEAIQTPSTAPEEANRARLAVDKLVIFLSNGGEIHYLPGPDEPEEEFTKALHGTLKNFYAIRDSSMQAPRLTSGTPKRE